ncbi:MAG: hypothetical protein ACYDH6_21905 [Acidimicrobiales bacterium]
MNPARTVVLDNEAIQALVDVVHPKHRRTLAAVEVTAARNLRRAGAAYLVVPTAVRVEVGWNRQGRRSAALNRLRVIDSPLDGQAADRAAEVVSALGVSVADAHLAAVVATTDGPHAVLTSDRADVQRIAAHIGAPITLVAI